MQYNIKVKNDSSMPGFWEVCVYDKSGAIVFMDYAENKAEAQEKGEMFVATKQGRTSKGSSIGGSSNYANIGEVLLAYNDCKISKREAETEMKKINPALSPNDIEDILVVDNPNPPNCGNGGGNNEVVYPHSMYDCETGKEYIAYNEEKHDYYASLGYVHDLEKDCGSAESTSEGPFGLFSYDWLLTERNRFILIGAFTIWLIYYYGRD